jgi:endonuclease/exonuclease/phosphatase family metal-dependent hydrolase
MPINEVRVEKCRYDLSDGSSIHHLETKKNCSVAMISSRYFIKEFWQVTTSEKSNVRSLLLDLERLVDICAFPCWSQHHAIVFYQDRRSGNRITPDALGAILQDPGRGHVLRQLLFRYGRVDSSWSDNYIRVTMPPPVYIESGVGLPLIPAVHVPNQNVRILSWNLDSFEPMAYSKRFLDVFGTGYHAQFDLIATMETGVRNYTELLSHLDDFDSWHGSKQHPDPYRQGQAIYWRRSMFTRVSRQTVALPAKAVAVVVRLEHVPTKRPVVVVAVHLKSQPTYGENCQPVRDQQSSTIMSFLETYLTPTDTLVVMGDWNEPTSHGNVHRFEHRFGLLDVYESLPGSHLDGSTMTDQKWLVDHALVGSDMDVMSVYPTGKSQYAFGPRVTDHFPLRFDVKLHRME